MMKFLVSLYLKFCGKCVGSDAFGNRYYELSREDSFGRKKRYCLYKGRVDGTKIPPEWHLFMHYQIEASDVTRDPKKYKWQRASKPDLTLTDFKYMPKNSLLAKPAERGGVGRFKAWSPN